MANKTSWVAGLTCVFGLNGAVRRRHAGFTLVEVIIISLFLVVLAALILPAIHRPHINAGYIRCLNHLKQIGLSFNVFAFDHENSFPMALPTAKGGTADEVGTTNVYRHFQVLSNELQLTKLLICPCDSQRLRGTSSWAELRNVDIDYWAGVDARVTNSSHLLAGEKFIQANIPITNHLLVLRPYSKVGWNSVPITNYGNVVFADGHVERFPSPSWSKWLKDSGQETIRLAVP